MKDNRWIEKWVSLPLGQRRATVALLGVVAVLSVVQIAVNTYSHNNNTPATEYIVLEEEIARFREQLDTVPEDERPVVYVRRTHARPDSDYIPHQEYVHTKKSQKRSTPSQQPAIVQPVPRIDEAVVE